MNADIITAITRIIVIVITAIIIPTLKAWIDDKVKDSKYDQIRRYAYIAVSAAEQIQKTMEQKDPDGEMRKYYAQQAIAVMSGKIGLSLTEKEINALIESAVFEMHLEVPHEHEGN